MVAAERRDAFSDVKSLPRKALCQTDKAVVLFSRRRAGRLLAASWPSIQNDIVSHESAGNDGSDYDSVLLVDCVINCRSAAAMRKDVQLC